MIKKILSDEKAQDLFYQTEGLFKSIQSIHEYLEVGLSKYFDEQIEVLRKKMTAIKEGVTGLESKGIDLKKSLESIMFQEQPVCEVPRPSAEKSSSFLATMGYYVAYPFVAVYNLIASGFKTIGSWFGLTSTKKRSEESPKAIEAVVEQHGGEHKKEESAPEIK